MKLSDNFNCSIFFSKEYHYSNKRILQVTHSPPLGDII